MEFGWRMHALDALATAPAAAAWIASMAMVVAVAVIDWHCPAEIAASHAYLLPVAIASWSRGHRGAVVSGAVAATVWLVVDLWTHTDHAFSLLEAVNVLVLLTVFALFGELIAALRGRLDRERRLANTDPLTGIFNRRAFWSAAQREVARCRRDEVPFAVAYLDLDGFKAVNDRHGHEVGDAVLCIVARTMQRSLRELDMVARLGGDEFALLLPGTDASGARAVLDRLRGELAGLTLPAASRVEFSVGCLAVESEPPDVDVLIARADRLMYELKTAGGGRVQHETWRPGRGWGGRAGPRLLDRPAG